MFTETCLKAIFAGHLVKVTLYRVYIIINKGKYSIFGIL